MQSIADYFDLRKEFVSFKMYHRNMPNEIVHLIVEPVHYICLLFLVNNFLPPVDGTGVNLSVIMNMVYMISYLFMEIPAGILYMPFMGLWYYVAVYILQEDEWLLVVTTLVTCWISLLLSHAYLEHKTPPYGPFFLQGFHGVLFFIWLDLLFHFGYKPHLRGEIDALVASKDKKAQ
ncbi:hypothetical protein FOZ63_002127 [Perkinsus olseni]|uniref:Uncharacterized protein n=1 Tax=Perkinsus olseni TaxID=32597 RepID=A0A7J6QSR3_PEROL|nr:hypothetical protein FOZ62_024036 [Perkinsus olseni]KAF4727406.1 hypothetical protein FOZ63_002127 [Perkinsus olseni]